MTLIFPGLIGPTYVVTCGDKPFIDALGDAYLMKIVGKPIQEPSLLDQVIQNNELPVSKNSPL